MQLNIKIPDDLMERIVATGEPPAHLARKGLNMLCPEMQTGTVNGIPAELRIAQVRTQFGLHWFGTVTITGSMEMAQFNEDLTIATSDGCRGQARATSAQYGHNSITFAVSGLTALRETNGQ